MKSPHLLIGVAVLCITPSAFAYIDPGSGMLMWQGLIAAIGAVIVFARNPMQSIKKFWARFKRK